MPGTLQIRVSGQHGPVLSAKTRYGLVALLELASIHAQGGVLQVGEIAARQQIPDRYLEQMLTNLRRAAILRSIRGPRGGYQLARAPSAIRLSDVVTCLEGDAAAAAGRSCPATAEAEAVRGLQQQLVDAHHTILAGETLQSLLDQRDQLAQTQSMYFI